MGVYIVTYDLNNEKVRPNITKSIKSYDSWAMLSESSYAVSTSDTPGEIYTKLKKHLDGDDQIYVIRLSNPHCGQGDTGVNDWLARELSS